MKQWKRMIGIVALAMFGLVAAACGGTESAASSGEHEHGGENAGVCKLIRHGGRKWKENPRGVFFSNGQHESCGRDSSAGARRRSL